MNKNIKELSDRIENSQAANMALLCIQGYVPKDDLEKKQLDTVRKNLIVMRDTSDQQQNFYIKKLEGK